MAHVDEHIKHLYDGWFLSEPALHAVLCSHDVCPSSHITCAVRSGKGRIEYNPSLLEQCAFDTVEELFRAEVIRILLKHPYERQPVGCPLDVITMASNCVLTSSYRFRHIKLDEPSSFSLESGQYFEWYALHIATSRSADGDSGNARTASEDSSSSDDNGSDTDDESTSSQRQAEIVSSLADQSALWDEDESQQYLVNEIINSTTFWGSLRGDIVEEIIASTQARIDYRKILQGFRSSVLSSRRSLTRMRPNRRTDFQNMGSVYRFSTRVLVAVDVSGSVSSASLSHFYGIVNRFFRYGVERVDTVQFDAEMHDVVSLRKASKTVSVCGRGGTDFQPLFDYVNHETYDGLVILTDGFAPRPSLPDSFHTKVLWVCDTPESYEANHQWMETIGRACTFNI